MITAISMMHNEAELCQRTIRHLFAQGVDRVTVLDNLSTDGTGDLCRDAGAEVLPDDEPGYFQSQKMTRLAHYVGGDWLVPFDADELWCGSPDLRTSLCGAERCVGAAVYNFFPTPIDPLGHAYDAIRFREPDSPGIKVAVRYSNDLIIGHGNHTAVTASGGMVPEDRGITIRHYPYRNVAQFLYKIQHGKKVLRLAGMEAQAYGWYEETAEEFVRCWVRDTDAMVYDPLETL